MQNLNEQVFSVEDFTHPSSIEHDRTVVMDIEQLNTLRFLSQKPALLEVINPPKKRDLYSDSHPMLCAISSDQYVSIDIDFNDLD